MKLTAVVAAATQFMLTKCVYRKHKNFLQAFDNNETRPIKNRRRRLFCFTAK